MKNRCDVYALVGVAIIGVCLLANAYAKAYSFDIRLVPNPPENIVYPFHQELDVVTSVWGKEVARKSVGEDLGCTLQTATDRIFKDSVAEIFCSGEGATDVYAMHVKGGHTEVEKWFGDSIEGSDKDPGYYKSQGVVFAETANTK